MTIKKTHSEMPAAKARSAATRAVGTAPRPASANGVAAQTAKDKATCEGALMRVIRLAQATLQELRGADGSAKAASQASSDPKTSDPKTGEPKASESQPSEPKPAGAKASGAQSSLEQALDGLDSEVALKLRTLMIAGRDGKNIGDVNVNLTLDDSKEAFSAAAVDTSQNGPLLADYLKRGHALACAAALDLERPLASWSGTTSHTLDERAWLSFGKQLAKAEPDDWQCLAFVDGNQSISRLYLRLQGHAWWSFQAVLDRPSAAVVEKHERTLSSRRSKGLSTRSLSSLVSRLSSTEGRALKRAARAIRARVGDASAT